MKHYLYSLALCLLIQGQSAKARPLVDPVRLPAKAQKTAPRIMLWSWQKIEDLSSIDTATTGVALLTGRFVVDSAKIILEPRLSQLNLPPGCYREAVARVEMKSAPGTDDIPRVSKQLAHSITRLALAHGRVDALQIDFDARELDRPFYIELLKELRAQLPATFPLSITALASWSQGDGWLKAAMNDSKLPVDYVVPMFFTMGVGKDQALKHLSNTLPTSFNGHRAIGLSLSEPATFALVNSRLNQFDHIYLFCSPGWRRDRLKSAGNLVDQKLLKEYANAI